jgi:hypothetical protein
MRNAYSIFNGNPEGKNNSEDLGVDGMIILEWILEKQIARVWNEYIWLKIGTTVRVL